MSPRILQIGLGGFGRNHLRAWHELGLADGLHVAELDPSRHADCRRVGLPAERVATSFRDFLPNADVVDIVTPTDSHFGIAHEALLAGKDVFIEKPFTLTLQEATELASLAAEQKRVVGVGFYYRFHPIAQTLKTMIDQGEFGDLQYLSGEFMGFKRARTDVGVMHTDGIHFLDLFNWLAGSHPVTCYAVTRDHFGRDKEDLAIALMSYLDGVIAKVECGYIQPGEWRDKVVPNAFTTKRISVVGRLAAAEADFETDRLVIHHVEHEAREGTWWPRHTGSVAPPVGGAGPIEMLKRELTAFLGCVESREMPLANAWDSGVHLAALIEAIYTSARDGQQVAVPATGDRPSLSV